jgi:response regulator of citrate/malate metabolism
MATIDTARLDAALQAKLIKRSLKPEQKLFLHPSVVTVCELLEAIASSGKDGLSVEQLSDRVGIHPNTVAQYTRWLIQNNLIRLDFEITETSDRRKRRNVYIAA